MTRETDGLDEFDNFTRDMASKGMFNDDQLDHMRHLSSLPAEKKCQCGWHLKGECPNCPDVEHTQ